jgi:hypothetical protein
MACTNMQQEALITIGQQMMTSARAHTHKDNIVTSHLGGKL